MESSRWPFVPKIFIHRIAIWSSSNHEGHANVNGDYWWLMVINGVSFSFSDGRELLGKAWRVQVFSFWLSSCYRWELELENIWHPAKLAAVLTWFRFHLKWHLWIAVQSPQKADICLIRCVVAGTTYICIYIYVIYNIYIYIHTFPREEND
jgi:hypothetical protein